MQKFRIAALAAALCLALAGRARADETPAMQAYAAGMDALQRAAISVESGERQSGWAEAEKHFHDAVMLKTDYAEAYDKQGQAQFNQGKIFDAITSFKHAVAIDPRLTEAWYDLGYGFENEDTDRKLVVDKHYFFGLGTEKKRIGWTYTYDDKTRKKLQKAEIHEALDAYRQALLVNPSNDIPSMANAHFRLGVLLRDLAVDAAEKASAGGVKVDPDKENLKEAMLHLEAANELISDFPEARNELGRLYDIIGRYPEAIDQYTKAIKGHADYAEAYSNRGVAWWKAGNWDRALEDTLKATEIDPDFAGGHYNYAEVIFARVQELRQNGDNGARSVIHPEAQKAIDEYSIATRLEPDWMPAWYGLAKAYHGYYDFPNAEKTYAHILAKDKRQKKAKLLLKALLKEEKTFTSHIPKQYQDTVKKGN